MPFFWYLLLRCGKWVAEGWYLVWCKKTPGLLKKCLDIDRIHPCFLKYFSDCCRLRINSFLNVSHFWTIASCAFLITMLSRLPDWCWETRALHNAYQTPAHRSVTSWAYLAPQETGERWKLMWACYPWGQTHHWLSGSLGVYLLSCPFPGLWQVVQKRVLLGLAGNDTNYSSGSPNA